MGCSIGGRAVLHLALQHGASFRAAIGLQSALYADPGANPALRDLELIHRPDVHGGDVSAAFVSCLIAPTSPAADRAETLWHYSQSGPGVFMGDLVYYMADGDMRNLDLSPLKAQQCPLYLLDRRIRSFGDAGADGGTRQASQCTAFRGDAGARPFPDVGGAGAVPRASAPRAEEDPGAILNRHVKEERPCALRRRSHKLICAKSHPPYGRSSRMVMQWRRQAIGDAPCNDQTAIGRHAQMLKLH